MPLYFFSLILAPCSVSKKMDQIVRNFRWDRDEEKKNYHLVNWNLVSKPKDREGLGISVAKSMNKALLSKWWWRFSTEKNNLWRIIVKEKYGELETERETRKPKGTQGVSICHNIHKTLGEFKKG